MSLINVALVQAAPALFDLEGSLEKVADWAEQAASEGAQLVLFPEGFLPAYPRGLGFGSVVGSRTPKGREDWLTYFRNSVRVPGPATERLGRIARENQLYLAIGVTEIGESGGTLYCTLLYFNPAGQLIHRHRKLKPTAAERIIWGEGQGDDLDVLSTPLGRIGGLICWENYMPLARMALYAQDIHLYLAPTADHRESWQSTIRHIACEGRCFVLSCNQFVRKDMYPETFQEELRDQPEILSRGGSAIISPLGGGLAGPLWDKEGMLVAALDPEDIIRARLDFDAFGHYHRSDVFFFDWRKKN
ncbi:MAG: carbon-nitrogen hydrolase family protein [Haliscomenobacter sp.]|nr:carbon-nitrogen hydrolase family protein [Haliscomenobacter sp.]